MTACFLNSLPGKQNAKQSQFMQAICRQRLAAELVAAAPSSNFSLDILTVWY